MVFLEGLTTLAAQLGHFGGSVKKGVRFSAEVSSVLSSFWGSFPSKLTNTCKKWHPESSQNKSRHYTSSEVAQCVIRAVPAIVLEGSNHVHLDGFWPHFGYLLESFSETLGTSDQF